MREFLTMQEVATMLGVSVKTVSRLILSGKLPASRVGGVYRIRLADVDDYLERRKVVVGKPAEPPLKEGAWEEREAEVRVAAEPRTCARCQRLLRGPSPVAGRCQAPGCEAVLCRSCWGSEQDRFCRDHAIPREERLARAREKLQRGEIPLLVTPEEARERELRFIARFDLKMREKPFLLSPLDGARHAISSWDLVHSEGAELDTGKFAGLRWAMGSAAFPRNLSSTYSWPPPGTARSVSLGGRFLIAAVAFADLAEFSSQGFSVTPAGRNRLWQFLEERVATAKVAETFNVVGLASPTGWATDAEELIAGGPGRRSFTSLYLSLCLVDLHHDRIIFNPADRRLRPFVPLFRGELDTEAIARVVNWVRQGLLSGRASLTAREVAAGTGVDMSIVREALIVLESEGGYAVDNLPEYGLVVSRAL